MWRQAVDPFKAANLLAADTDHNIAVLDVDQNGRPLNAHKVAEGRSRIVLVGTAFSSALHRLECNRAAERVNEEALQIWRSVVDCQER